MHWVSFRIGVAEELCQRAAMQQGAVKIGYDYIRRE
jgi:hypothetical protein